jgi:hypothetical protein
MLRSLRRAAPQRTAVVIVLLAATTNLSVAASSPASVPATLDPRKDVTTYAGNGTAGRTDGPLRSASFLLPTGLAYDRTSQTLYVVDSAAQSIRAIHGNVVTTIAGTATMLPDGLAAAGGYRDGPAHSAQFNAPRGIAIGPDGALYVADTGNHCIRRIRDGTVTTYLGKADAPGHVDGALADATLQSPRSLAFAADGTLYVSDHGNGLRQIKQGIVSTITLPGDKDNTYYNAGVDQVVYVPGSPDAVLVSSATGILRYEPSTQHVTGEASYPYSHPAGVSADGAVAVTATSALVVSMRWNSVSFVQFPNGLGTVSAFARTLTAQTENPSATAGYRNGFPGTSRFFGPVSIVAKGDGTYFVADAGNRVIRTFPSVNARWPAVQTVPIEANPHVFRIAVIGDSYAFWNCMYDDSIQGRLGQLIETHRAKNSLPIDVIPARLDGSDLAAQASYITNVLGQGSVNIVVWLVDSATFGLDPRSLPAVFPGDRRASASQTFVSTEKLLRSNGSRLLVVTHPSGIDVGPGNSMYYKLMASNYAGPPSGTFDSGYAFDQSMDQLVSDSRVPFLSLLPAFVNASLTPHEALFSPDDFHFSGNGNAMVAEKIAEYLLLHRSWLAGT